MAGEIIPDGPHNVSVVTGHGIGGIIKPMIREIHLLDTWIAGTMQTEDRSALKALQPEEELFLRREENSFDSMAILVLNRDNVRLGYIPEKDNVVFARLMDAGKTLKARVGKTEEKDSWTRVIISVYLVDL